MQDLSLHNCGNISLNLTVLDSLEVETGGTPFQRTVWHALREIPAGATMSYGALAKRIGRPSAVRAVGLANGANPIGIVVPCHRVIGADGSQVGVVPGGGQSSIRHRKQAVSPGRIVIVCPSAPRHPP